MLIIDSESAKKAERRGVSQARTFTMEVQKILDSLDQEIDSIW